MYQNIYDCTSVSRSAVSPFFLSVQFPDIGPATLPPSGQGFEHEPAAGLSCQSVLCRMDVVSKGTQHAVEGWERRKEK